MRHSQFLNKEVAAKCMTGIFIRNNVGELGMEQHPNQVDQCPGCGRLEKYLQRTLPENLASSQDPVSMKRAIEWADRTDRYMMMMYRASDYSS